MRALRRLPKATVAREVAEVSDPIATVGLKDGLDPAAVIPDGSIGSVESMVPIITCHSVENIEQVQRRIASVVWLQTLDECTRLLGDPIERSGRPLPLAGAVRDSRNVAPFLSDQVGKLLCLPGFLWLTLTSPQTRCSRAERPWYKLSPIKTLILGGSG